MPFEQKYSPETREAALSRVLTRRDAEPGNRAIIREAAEEFKVGEQSLRGWIRAHEKANAPVVKKTAEPASTVSAGEPDAGAAATRRSAGRPVAAASTDARVAELEAEVARLRREREALKSALNVLIGD